MKELYIEPELTVISFASAEKITSGDDLLGDSGVEVNPTSMEDGDIDLEL